MTEAASHRASLTDTGEGHPHAQESLRQRLARLPAVARSVRTVLVLASGLRADPITLRAAALSYLSVLSIVPLLTVVFSIFQAVVGQQQLEARLRDFLFSNVVAGASQNVSRYLTIYIQRASAVGGVGFVFLLFSSASLMANIETAFNHIFRVTRPRPLLLRFGVYWCLLTVGPVLLALSVAITALLETTTSSAHWLGPLRQLSFVGPLVITYAAFLLMYVVVPAVRVQIRPALLGALVGGTAWEIAKIGYAEVSTRTMHNAIYGSLSAFPVFLVWVYISWILVLFGARVTYAAQTTGMSAAVEPAGTPRERELVTAHVMRAIAFAFARGHNAPDAERLTRTLGAFGQDVEDALVRLTDAKLIRAVREGGWVPARALSGISLAEVRAAARQGPPRAEPEPESVHLEQRWQRADDAADRELSMTLEDLVRNSTLPG
jgi:membrane protein